MKQIPSALFFVYGVFNHCILLGGSIFVRKPCQIKTQYFDRWIYTSLSKTMLFLENWIELRW